MDNFLSKFRDIFQGEQVPMAASPSIVKAGEDEDIYVDSGPQANPFTGGAPYKQDQSTGAPTPYQQDQSTGAPTAYSTNPFTGGGPYSPEIPPELAAPGTIVPPIQNETLKDSVPALDAVPEIVEGVPGSERDEAQAYVDRVNARIEKLEAENVDPDRLVGLKRSRDEVLSKIEAGEYSEKLTKREQYRNEAIGTQHTPHRRKVMQGMLDREERLRAEGRIQEANNVREGIDAMKSEDNKPGALGLEIPGIENSEVDQTPEEAAAVESAVNSIPDDAPTNSPTPGGGTTPVTGSDVKRVAAEDPKGFSKAMNWIQKTFGITGQDLARFALLYAGSRIAGYGHGESMSWGFEVAAKDMLGRRDMGNRLAQQDKYTPESIEKYRRTGDVSALKEKAKGNAQVVNWTKSGYMKQGSKLVRVHPAKDESGNQYWVDQNGKRLNGDVVDVAKRRQDIQEGRDKATKNYGSTIGDFFPKANQTDRKGNLSPFQFSPDAEARIMSETIMDWNESMGANIDSAVAHRLISNAARQARAWQAATGGIVTGLEPFLNAQMIYMDEGNTWARDLKKNGQPLNPDEIATMNSDILSFITNDPSFSAKAEGIEQGALMGVVMGNLYKNYLAIPESERDNMGFYDYVRMVTTTKRER